MKSATWEVGVVDAAVKLYLLALVRTDGDHDKARTLSGLEEREARSALGWLKEVGVVGEDGSIIADRLHSARGGGRLSMLVA